MNIKMRYLYGVMALSALMIINSCGDDDPPPKAGITFEVAELVINESNGTVASFHPVLGSTLPGSPSTTGREIEIRVISDKPLDDVAVVAISFSGTATANSSTNPIGDYEVVGGSQNFTIEKGATSAFIKIRVFEDFAFEIDNDDNLFETVVVKLTSVISGPATIGEQDTHTLKIKEDDIVVILDWEALDRANPTDNQYRGDVDMDLLLYLNNSIIRASASAGNDYEAFNIPGGFPAGTYGLSYPYYSGSSDDVEFVSLMFSTSGTLNGNGYVFPIDEPLVFDANYTLQNLNVWDTPADPGYKGPPQVIQTMLKSGINYSNITQITPPADGSRIRSWQHLKQSYPGVFEKLRLLDQSRSK
jgi:hypothetical protein